MISILVTSETRVAGKDYSQTNKIFKTPSLKIYAIFHLGIIGSIYLRDQASTFISILPKIAFLLEIKVKASKPGVACKLFKRRTNHPNLFQSVDMINAIISDPYILGKIAANHAISDIISVNSKMISALMISACDNKQTNLATGMHNRAWV